ncbi:type III pantothenate kinase [bacterium]|nr:type III pantothenate kinase [bacterium]
MIALFDSGNTHLHFGWWDGRIVLDPVSVPYPSSQVELTNLVSDLLNDRQFAKAVACSVNSRWRERLFSTVGDFTGGGLSVARKASDFNLVVNYENPAMYGIDRALEAYAAFEICKTSCIVIDVGTAVTVDAVANDGTVAGGFIFPGAPSLVHGLASLTDLPFTIPDFEHESIGQSTGQCISYGAALGLAGAITRLVKVCMDSIGGTDHVVITGGGAEPVMKYLPFTVEYHQFLVLTGLGLVADILPKYA